MNKKIKEIANLVKLQPYYDAQEGQIEQFAKLILQVAMEVVRDEVAYHSDWDCADDVIKTVNEYFGVE